MSDWTNTITMDLLVEYIVPYASCSGVELLFITEKRIYEAMKQKEYSYRIWNAFWKRTEREYVNEAGFFLEEDQLLWKELYKDGKLEGKQLAYHENGQLAFQRFYEDGMLTGKEHIWDEEGALYCTCEYKDDKPHGNVFDCSLRNGTHITEVYEDGIQIYSLNTHYKLIYSYVYDDNDNVYKRTRWTRDEHGTITHTEHVYYVPGGEYLQQREFKVWEHIGKERRVIRHILTDENHNETILV